MEPGSICQSITTRETPKRQMKETLFTRHRNTVEPIMLADNRKATLQTITLTRKERATLAQLRSGYCKLLGFYKSRIKKDASFNVSSDCGKTPHDVKHLFTCLAHPTTLTPSDLWSKPSGNSAISRQET